MDLKQTAKGARSPFNAIEAHVRESALRDEVALRRDLAARDRDAAAERRDREMTERERAMAARGSSLEAALRHAATLRERAAKDRELAADDRRQAARDRVRAAQARAEALTALYYAHLDDLTGAFLRGMGEQAIRGEIERARRANGKLVLGLVDVDGLKHVNDEQGHLAGDILLRDVVEAIRMNIRSYEPVVRLGGDEFAFTVAGLGLDGVRERLVLIRADMARSRSGGTFTVGIAELRPHDELPDLVERADAALVAARRQQLSRVG